MGKDLCYTRASQHINRCAKNLFHTSIASSGWGKGGGGDGGKNVNMAGLPPNMNPKTFAKQFGGDSKGSNPFGNGGGKGMGGNPNFVNKGGNPNFNQPFNNGGGNGGGKFGGAGGIAS